MYIIYFFVLGVEGQGVLVERVVFQDYLITFGGNARLISMDIRHRLMIGKYIMIIKIY